MGDWQTDDSRDKGRTGGGSVGVGEVKRGGFEGFVGAGREGRVSWVVRGSPCHRVMSLGLPPALCGPSEKSSSNSH